ncbi:hypothetical protein CCR75_007404 [Bremia lactucae]|uniref:FYVE-type domain-containing protein n=1 Tax=Bremia lactucae TaxID=4779 RepID=A0A976ILR8_BRELC|nr:hypothetical protein CCR75_007404 [Bremia lactucae]
MAGRNCLNVSPFPEVILTDEARSQLAQISNELVMAKFAEAQAHNFGKDVDHSQWRLFRKDGNTAFYLERNQFHGEPKLPTTLMVGSLPGSLDENMFGFVSPTIEATRIKTSYLNDFDEAAVLATIVEPTLEEPFHSIVVKWIEIDIPGATIGLVRNRDYVVLESSGIIRLENGGRVGYHLIHSVNFPQTHELPKRVRGNMSFCGLFCQRTPDITDCRGTGIMDPSGDVIHPFGVMGMAQALMAGLKYSYCGQMKKLAWLVEQKHSEAKAHALLEVKPLCVLCQQKTRAQTFGIPRRTCKLCFGTLCFTCAITKKLSFITADLDLVQRRMNFCAKCLIQATHFDTIEAARVQFVYKRAVPSSIYKSSAQLSNESELSDDISWPNSNKQDIAFIIQ